MLCVSEVCLDAGSWYTGNTLPWHGRVAGPIPAESTLRSAKQSYEVARPQVLEECPQRSFSEVGLDLNVLLLCAQAY